MSDNYFQNELSKSKNELNRLQDDYKQLKLFFESQKKELEIALQEKQIAFQKNNYLICERNEINQKYEQNLRNLKFQLEEQQYQLDIKQTQFGNTQDIELLKFQITQDLETQHKLQIDSKLLVIDKMKDQEFQYKRQIQILEAKIDCQKNETDQIIKQEKELFNVLLLYINIHQDKKFIYLKKERKSFQQEIKQLNNKDLVQKLQEEIIELQAINEQQISQIEIKNGQIIQLKKLRDSVNEEKDQLFINFNKQIENERFEKHELLQQIDSYKRQVNRFENQKQNIHQFENDDILREKENLIKSQQQKICELQINNENLTKSIATMELQKQTILDHHFESPNEILKQQLSQLNQYNNQLIEQIQNQKQEIDELKYRIIEANNEGDQEQLPKVSSYDDPRVQQLKKKLKQANNKIISLFKDKIQLASQQKNPTETQYEISQLSKELNSNNCLAPQNFSKKLWSDIEEQKMQLGYVKTQINAIPHFREIQIGKAYQVLENSKKPYLVEGDAENLSNQELRSRANEFIHKVLQNPIV